MTLCKLLAFATGASEVPPIGFSKNLHLTFLHDDNSKFPKANTCSLELHLPIHISYEDFRSNMDFGILNGAVFGFA